MTDRAEYLRRAEQAEHDAAELKPGYGRNELQRVASAFRRIAEILEEEQSSPESGSERERLG